MTNGADYRLYLESKFDSIDEKLDKIVEQTTKTNGRVNDLEKEDSKINKRIDDALLWANHIVDTRNTDCPHTGKINTMVETVDNIIKEKQFKQKESESFWTKYRDILTTAGTIIAFLTLFVMMFWNNERTAGLKKQVDLINTPVRTRDGSIQWYPSGVVIDSLNKTDQLK